VKNTCSASADGGNKHVGKHHSRPEAQKRRFGWSGGKIAVVLAVAGLALIVVFLVPRGQQNTAEPLKRAGYSTGVPINNADPTSGKAIVAGVNSEYKGYTIGHCCAVSKGDWEALSVDQKDAFVRRFVR
jgi:hypothetical protein